MNNIIKDIGYTGKGDKNSKRKTFLSVDLPKTVAEMEKRTIEANQSDELHGNRSKTIIPSNNFHKQSKSKDGIQALFKTCVKNFPIKISNKLIQNKSDKF